MFGDVANIHALATLNRLGGYEGGGGGGRGRPMQGDEVRRERLEGENEGGFDQNTSHACMTINKTLFKKKKTKPTVKF